MSKFKSKVTFTEDNFNMIRSICDTTGRQRQFSTVVNYLLAGELVKVMHMISAGEKRKIANLISMIDNREYGKLRGELVLLYEDVKKPPVE